MNGTPNNLQRRSPACQKRHAFTLLELILAVALSATLLGLIGTAINLYLSQVDADRTRVEEAQLARSVLAMIADDIRGATIYQPQDTKAIEALMTASTPYNVDDVDKSKKPGAPAAPASPTKIAALTAIAATSGQSTSSSSASGSSSEDSEETLPLGLNGTTEDVYVDVTRLPKQDELFATVTGYTNAQSPASTGAGGSGSAATATAADVNPPADLKTVHYHVRSDGGSTSSAGLNTSAMPTAFGGEKGLVRQEIPRTIRVFAEQAGKTDATESQEVLLAPEVVKMQFRYFSGSELFDTWEMKERKTLPVAIEVKIWLKPPSANGNRATNDEKNEPTDKTSLDAIENAHEYRQIVYLPMASLVQSSSTSTSESSSSTESQGEAVQAGQAAFDQN